METEQSALLGTEILLGDSGIGEQLPAALVVEVADHGGDDAVLTENEPHAVEPMAGVAFQRQEIARLVIPINDIEPGILVEDFVTLYAQLGGIGMDDGETMALGEMRAQHRLLVRPFAHVFRLDETE